MNQHLDKLKQIKAAYEAKQKLVKKELSFARAQAVLQMVLKRFMMN